MTDDKEPKSFKIIDVRLPLHWVLATLGGLAFVLISMYFSVNQLLKDVGEVQSTTRQSNVQLMGLSNDVAILKHRVDRLDSTPPPTRGGPR